MNPSLDALPKIGAPDVPSPDASTVMEPGGPYPFWANLSRRSTSDPSGAGLREWPRFRPRARFDDPFVDAASQLCCAAAPPP